MMRADLKREVFDALREVDDPELGVNIVDLGLVTACSLDGDQISIVLMMTTPTCPLGGLIAETAAVAVGKRLGPDYTVRVTVDRKATWSPDLASPEVWARFERKPSRLGAALKAGFSRLVGTS